jgi:hypothetical protein
MSLSIDFEDFIASSAPSKVDQRRRNKVLEHLRNIFGKVESGVSLHFSGISSVGLSPRRGGIEVNVTTEKKVEIKKLAKSISNKLKGWGLEMVVFSERLTPTIHGVNDRSGIPVRISFCDPTAVHQTAMMQLALDSGDRVKTFMLALHNWILHRNLGESSGGYSPFAWSMLGLIHLRRTGVIGELFSANFDSELVVGERILDVGLESDSAKVGESADKSLDGHQLFVSFTDWLSGFELPTPDVASLRIPDGISREDCDWPSPELGRLTKNTAPPHLWPLMHPFDFSFDLSSSLTVAGATHIIAESVRVNGEMPIEEIFATKSPKSLAFDEDKDLFEDLRKMDRKKINSDLTTLQKNKSVIESEVETIREQRRAQIRIVQALRGLVKDTQGVKSEHRTLLNRISERQKQINSLKSKRNNIHKRVVLPVSAIEEEISKTYHLLTGTLEDNSYPSLKREKNLFSQFLELQVMYEMAVQATEYHQQFVSLIKQQEVDVSELDSFKDEKEALKKKATESIPGAEEYKGQYRELEGLDQKITNQLQMLNAKIAELREVNREIGRLDAWLRIEKNKERKPKQGERKRQSRDKASQRRSSSQAEVKEAKRKATSGESMSMDDLDAILSSGGISSLNLKDNEEKSTSRRRKNRKQRKLSAPPPKRGTGRPDIEGKATRRRE